MKIAIALAAGILIGLAAFLVFGWNRMQADALLQMARAQALATAMPTVIEMERQQTAEAHAAQVRQSQEQSQAMSSAIERLPEVAAIAVLASVIFWGLHRILKMLLAFQHEREGQVAAIQTERATIVAAVRAGGEIVLPNGHTVRFWRSDRTQALEDPLPLLEQGEAEEIMDVPGNWRRPRRG